MRYFLLLTGLLVSSSLVIGCQENGSRDLILEKKPRPVETRTLRRSPPPSSAFVSASVASWKTEEIGFEVSGRVRSVAEPNTAIEGHIVEVIERERQENVDDTPVTRIERERKVIVQGTPVAQLETESYELQEQIAKADLARAQQAVAAAEIELNEGLKSDRLVVDAEYGFAKSEFDRIKRLWDQNAVPRSDFDRADASQKTAAARIKQLDANVRAKESEIVSLRLQIKHAEQTLRDAERNLRNCTLYSSFRGQIADVSVVPGSVVSAGTPVATIQMMDPIKVELEVSAEQSRELRSRQLIPVWLTQPNGAPPVREDGFLYLIDPVADTQTRTFTVTLLVLNKKSSIASPTGEDIPVTEHAWRLNLSFLPGARQGLTYIPQQAIHQDQDGLFLWRINNMKIRDPAPEDSLLKVQKMRIEMGETKLPFLGNWVFQQVNVLDPTFDPKVHLVAGRLLVKSGNPDDWVGDTIVVDRSNQWMLRPGDIVKVDLSPAKRYAEPGFYVPMDALAREAGKTFLFVVQETGGSGDNSTGQVVRRTEVTIVSEDQESTSSMLQVKPIGDSSLDGLRYVTRGAHYLRDGELVRTTVAAGASE